MALVPIGGQLAKAIDSDFRVRLNPFYSITFTIPFYLIETSLMIRFYTSTKKDTILSSRPLLCFLLVPASRAWGLAMDLVGCEAQDHIL